MFHPKAISSLSSLVRGRGPLVSAAVLAVSAGAMPAMAEPVTYQGRLDEAGSPASGTFDLRFNLFSTETGGTSLLTQAFEDVVIEDGVFTVELDIPAGVLADTPRWIEIGVRPGASGGVFTTLTPRQSIGAAPFAITDLSEPWQRTPGSLQYNDGNVLIGRDFTIGSEVFGIGADTSSFAGMYVSTTGATGLPFYGYSAGGDIDAFHYFDGSSGLLRFFVVSGDVLNMDSNSVGINMDPSGVPGLSVDGEINVTGRAAVGGFVTVDPALPAISIGSSAVQVEIDHFGSILTDDVRAFGEVRAESVRSQVYNYEFTQQRELVVSFADFVGTNDASGAQPVFRDVLQRVTYINGGSGRLVAPVQLPDGANITGITIHAEDDLSTRALSVSLIRSRLDASVNSSTIESVLQVQTSEPLAATVELPITSTNVIGARGTVDNGNFFYYVQAVPRTNANGFVNWPGGDVLAIRAVKISYTVDSPD